MWGLDSMGPFPSSLGNTYILVVVDYISKWVKVVALPNNNAKSVVKFLHKNILTRFGTPRAIISDEVSHFDCKYIAKALMRYGVKHKISNSISSTNKLSSGDL